MDPMQYAPKNSVALAVLGSILFWILLVAFSNLVFMPAPPKVPGFALPSAPEATASAPAKPGAPETPLPVLLAKADVTKGMHDAKICETCHNVEKGGGVKIGPPLWGVVGRKVASVPGFDYSDSLKSHGGDWTFQALNKWITDPRAVAPGTKMAFAGEAEPQKRADILAYLRTLSDSPVPLPKAAAAPAATAAPAAAAPAAAAPAAAPSESLHAALEAANPAKGKQDAKICEACHNLDKGGGPKIGPDLWGVVGRKIASVPGFDYSSSLKSVGGDWTYEMLNKWVDDPKSVAPDTKMTYPGEKNLKKRADILAYLRTLSDAPVPFPK